MESLRRLLEKIVGRSIPSAHGCILIVDRQMGEEDDRLEARRAAPGEWFERPVELQGPDDLDDLDPEHQSLALAGCVIDGALYLDDLGRLHAIGCILEGRALEDENRGYGARHRSAARFTHTRKSTVAITVSEDGHVTAFFAGEVLDQTSPLPDPEDSHLPG